VNEDHRRWSDDLAAYVLDALEPAEETCKECSAQLRWLRPATDLLPETVPRLQPPPELRERVMAEVRGDAERQAPAKAARGHWRNLFLRPAVGLAGAAVIAAGLGGYLIAGDQGGDNQQTIPGPQGGAVTANLVRQGDSGTLELTGLSPLPANTVYQAWVQRDGMVIPSSLFAPRADGTASAAIPAHLDGADQVMVTREPKGGSPQPTHKPLVSVRINA
jgi:Anti-sigma-K factor rskA